MLNLFQHLIKSISLETLKHVQGDRKELFQQPVTECSRQIVLFFHAFRLSQ